MLNSVPIAQKIGFNDKDIISKTKVTIEKNHTSISVFAETPRLIIRSVKPDDVSFYQNQLWGNQQVMSQFADSQTRLYKDEDSNQKEIINYAQNRIIDAEDSWCTRWKHGNPWSGMTVIDKKNSNPIGHVIIGGGELAYLFIPEVWGQRIGSEAVTVLTKAILPSLVISGDAENLPKNIEATTRIEHIASQIVLARAGLTSNCQTNKRKFGDKEYERFIFKASVAELVQRYKDIKRDPQLSLPLYRLISSLGSKKADEINIGRYSLRMTEKRKKRYSY